MDLIPSHSLPFSAEMVTYVADQVRISFGVAVPEGLRSFWRANGFGYFNNREVCAFGPHEFAGRSSLIDWNRQDFWSSVFPTPMDGGPLFFADNCFGDQFGFRYEAGRCLFIVFSPASFESFVMSDNQDDFFGRVWKSRENMIDENKLSALGRVGLVPTEGMFLSHKLSVLLGGSDEVDNYTNVKPEVAMKYAVESALLRRKR